MKLQAIHKKLIVLVICILALSSISYTYCVKRVGIVPVVLDGVGFNMSAQRWLNTRVFHYSRDTDVTTVMPPNAMTAPGYTAFIASIYKFFPNNADALTNAVAAQPTIIIVQLLLAILTAPLIALIGYTMGGIRTGWAAGLLASAYAPIGINAAEQMTETISIFLFSLCFLIIAQLLVRPSKYYIWQIVALSVLGSATALVRPVFSLWMLVPLIVWIWNVRANKKRALLGAITAVVCSALILTPWAIRNYPITQKLTPFASSGIPLFDGTLEGPVKETEMAQWKEAAQSGQDPFEAVAKTRLANRWQKNPVEFITWKLERATSSILEVTNLPDFIIDFLHSNPNYYQQTPLAGDIETLPDNAFLSTGLGARVLSFYHYAIIALAIIGIYLGIRYGRNKALVFVAATLPLHFIAIHTSILILPRYLYPTGGVVIALAALGVVGLFDYIKFQINKSQATPT